jgi:hypothetical protein
LLFSIEVYEIRIYPLYKEIGVKSKASYNVIEVIVTFKDLQKLVHQSSNSEQTKLFNKLRNKPFWIWNVEEHKLEDIRTKGDCCFNHIIGMSNSREKEIVIHESYVIAIFVYNPLFCQLLFAFIPDLCYL